MDEIMKAFDKLITQDWDQLEYDFKLKYKTYRSKRMTGNSYVGIGKMIEMLEECNYRISVKK